MHPASIHDPIGDELAAAVTKARNKRSEFLDQWNRCAQLLFDPDQHSQQLMLEGGFDNSMENFNRIHENLRHEIIRAQEALKTHILHQRAPVQLSITNHKQQP